MDDVVDPYRQHVRAQQDRRRLGAVAAPEQRHRGTEHDARELAPIEPRAPQTQPPDPPAPHHRPDDSGAPGPEPGPLHQRIEPKRSREAAPDPPPPPRQPGAMSPPN